MEAEIRLTKAPRFKRQYVNEVNKNLVKGIWRAMWDETCALAQAISDIGSTLDVPEMLHHIYQLH